MKIRTKIFLAICLMIGGLLLALFIEGRYERKRLLVLFGENKKEQELIFDNIVRLKGEALFTLSYDYTYWDEMVRFVETRDTVWAEDNLDSALSTFQASAIWIYAQDGTLRYSVFAENAEGLGDLPFDAEAVKDLFSETPFRYFFINMPLGLFEVRAAKIVPSADTERKTPAQGYFFTGRIWNTDYLSELSALTKSEIMFVSREEGERQTGLSLEKGVIVFSRKLSGWDDRPLAYLGITREFETIRSLSRQIKQQYLIFISFVFFLGAVVLILYLFWVYRPLKLISQALSTEKDVLITAFMEKNDEFGEISRIIGESFKRKVALINEIEERRRSEQALRHSEVRFRIAAESTSDFIYDWDIASGRLDWFGDVDGCLGYAQGEFPRSIEAWRKIIHPDDYKRVIARLEDHFEKEERYSVEYRVVRKDGGILVWKDTGTALRNKDGVFYRMLGACSDVTEHRRGEEALRTAYEQLKSTQAQLVQSAKMASVGLLAGGVAHEINNPLTGVLNNIQLIRILAQEKKGGFTFEEFKELLAIVEDSALRCKKITQSLLDFSHASRGVFQPVSINEMVEKVVELVGHELELQNISIRKDLQADLPQVSGDAQLLQQVIFDFISNARWAIHQKTPKGEGTITLATRCGPGDRNVCLSISDTGIGIVKENLATIFEPFFTTKAVGEGTGLGLSIVYGIVQAHRGSIDVDSREGEGATFRIYLPLA